VTVSLPAELHDWLDDHAASLEVDRSTLLAQLLAAYRATVDLEDVEGGDITLQTLDEESYAASVDDAVQAQVADQMSEATDAIRTQLDGRIDALESEYVESLQDVRERVVQVKKEADAKAPADHTHEQLAEVADLAGAVADLEADVGTLRTEYEETASDHGERVEALGTRLEEVQDRLQTVAWAVSDLREAQESGGGLDAVDRIKRAAAKADIDRAACGNCGNGVQLSLLTDPECPHCSATVTDVEPGTGWFSSPKLVAASQLESGEDR
jgi:DNA anti-recombination protein RmuC